MDVAVAIVVVLSAIGKGFSFLFGILCLIMAAIMFSESDIILAGAFGCIAFLLLRVSGII